jgi:hypothetical protein
MVQEFSTDYRFEPGRDQVADAGHFLEWIIRGTRDGSTPQLPASGKQFAIQGISVGELEDVKIKRNADYRIMVEFLVQIDGMPAPTAGARHRKLCTRRARHAALRRYLRAQKRSNAAARPAKCQSPPSTHQALQSVMPFPESRGRPTA